MSQSRRGRAFTIAELMVTVAIISTLASMSLVVLGQIKAKARMVKCMSNQRQIGQGVFAFYNDHIRVPSDEEPNTLLTSLGPLVKCPEVFKCPVDRDRDSKDSYSANYVSYPSAGEGPIFSLGCPRHDEYVSLSDGQHTLFSEAGEVRLDGKEVKQDGTSDEKIIDSGTLTFEDGSFVTLTKAKNGFKATVVQSYRLSDGTLRTVVRITGEGKAKVHANPGSQFEVLTPAAVIAVRGTQFTVDTQVLDKKTHKTHKTQVKVSKGTVQVQKADGSETYTVSAGETVECSR